MTGRVAILALGFAAAALSAQQEPFRASVDLVTLDVAVLKDNKPVTSLAAGDFVVTDNGVRQRVEALSASALPLDVTVVIDGSGSMQLALATLEQQFRTAVSLLSPVDRLRVVVFSSTATQALEMSPAGEGLSIKPLAASGGTALFDALAAAMMRVRPHDRNELAIVLSDGIENSSVLSMPRLEAIAKRSDVPLNVYVTFPPEAAPAIVTAIRPDYGPLEHLANLTGGRMDAILSDGPVAAALSRVLDAYRKSYTLRYTATGVSRLGWHELKVSVAQPGDFVIRARRGYFGG